IEALIVSGQVLLNLVEALVNLIEALIVSGQVLLNLVEALVNLIEALIVSGQVLLNLVEALVNLIEALVVSIVARMTLGELSFRFKAHGSQFIQHLCEFGLGDQCLAKQTDDLRPKHRVFAEHRRKLRSQPL
ncbi:MAG: hypothetical protein RMM98_09750, partial [Acidobacteriota bacterium]|nr:hypothetical protein [Acidobacteriota bacterium]